MTDAVQPRVLLVDDDSTTRMLTAAALVNAGLDVVEAAGGKAALSEFENWLPDLVLLDVMMPDLDGFSVCRTIRSSRRGAYVPVIMLTGLEGSESIDEAYEAGATDYISKPINWTLLSHRVRYVLRAAATRQALAVSEERLLEAQRVARMGSWNWHAATARLDYSQTYPELFGVDEARFPHRLDAPLSHVHPADREVLEDALLRLHRGEAYQLDYRAVWPDGSVRTLRDIAVPDVEAEGGVVGAHGIVQDVTDQVEAERRIRYLAYFDALTGLPNRHAFSEALDAMLARAERQQEQVAVLLLDLHRFGLLNDSLGRDAADHVLQVVASRARYFASKVLGSGDVSDDTELAVAARYGSDQFAVMLCGPHAADDRAIMAGVDGLRAVVGAPIEVLRHSLVMQISIGMARYPVHARDAESSLKCAETALRQAKLDPARGSVLEYSASMRESSVSRLQIESALRSALDLDVGLSMHYQPKIDLASRRVIGAEALLRWRDPTLGDISPGDFVPLAEEMGLIIQLSEWVIEAVCRQVAEWRDRGLPRQSVAINLSAAHFRFAGLVDTVTGILDRYGLDGHDIEFELTESALLGDPELASQILADLHRRGLKVAVDDFGTGYSSLAYLKRFRLNTLKIDRSFVRDMEVDRSDVAIISSIVAMAETLGLGLVAEGVETINQARHLMSVGCHVMQGYLFAPALPAEAYAALLSGALETLTSLPPIEA